MPARRILQLGDPMLRAVSTPVSDFRESEPIFQDLRDTLHEFRRTHGFGRGISAVQIGEPTRLIYIEMAGVEYRPIKPEGESRNAEGFPLWGARLSFSQLPGYPQPAPSIVVPHSRD